MKKHILLFIILLLLVTQTKAQFILAGQHGARDHFAAPDTNITYECDIPITHISEYSIDMNGDGIIDFKLNVFCEWDNFNRDAYSQVIPINSNQIAFGYNDSCGGNTAHPFNNNDTINNNYTWMDSTLSLYADSWAYNDSFLGDYCFDSIFVLASDSGCIGVRVFLATDTLYGWIKVIGINDGNLGIESYACNLGITGINEYHNMEQVKLSPNPATNQLTIRTSLKEEHATVSIMNVLGQEVIQLAISNIQSSIDVSSLSSGIYFLQLKTESGNVVKKFVKQ